MGRTGYMFTDNDVAQSIAVNSKGYVFVMGSISNPADYDPGDGVSEHEGGRFLSTFDVNGNFVSVIVGPQNPERIFVDNNDDLYGIGS